MANVVPSDVVAAIVEHFGIRSEIEPRLNHDSNIPARLIVALMRELPSELITLPSEEYRQLRWCTSVLEEATTRWALGDFNPVFSRGRKDPIETIRRLLLKCSDQVPPPEPELPFIADLDIRNGIQDRIQAAWIDFGAREWMGATVIAGNALEALLLWALKQSDADPANEITRCQRDEALDKQNLGELIRKAENTALISKDTSAQAGFAKDARNLLHPGRVARSGEVCSKATALTALTAIYRMIEDLKTNLKQVAA